jgi:hypothetical protein
MKTLEELKHELKEVEINLKMIMPMIVHARKSLEELEAIRAEEVMKKTELVYQINKLKE